MAGSSDAPARSTRINRLVDAIAKGVPAEPIVFSASTISTAERTDAHRSVWSSPSRPRRYRAAPAGSDPLKSDVMELAEESKRGGPDQQRRGVRPHRSLVTAIVAHASPSAAGVTAPKAAEQRRIRIDLKGRLAELCDHSAVFPNVSMSGGTFPPTGTPLNFLFLWHHKAQAPRLR